MGDMTTTISDMDFIDSILSACSVKASKRQSIKAVTVPANKMDNCSVCPDASRKHCFDCMNDFYNHMHDPVTLGRLIMPHSTMETSRRMV
jgi:hypothetical protein